MQALLEGRLRGLVIPALQECLLLLLHLHLALLLQQHRQGIVHRFCVPSMSMLLTLPRRPAVGEDSPMLQGLSECIAGAAAASLYSAFWVESDLAKYNPFEWILVIAIWRLLFSYFVIIAFIHAGIWLFLSLLRNFIINPPEKGWIYINVLEQKPSS